MQATKQMRTQGKITSWNDGKGFGFITPASGAKQVFFHVRGFQADGKRPAVGQLVSFVLSTDRQGRPCAVRVALAGEVVPERIKRNDSVLMVSCAAAFLLLVALLTWAGTLPPIVFAGYVGLSVITFIAYALDKWSAESNRWRTQESTLHLLALAGGWPGAMVAQQLLRHKSMKQSFRSVFWFTVIVNCLVLVWMCTPWGLAPL